MFGVILKMLPVSLSLIIWQQQTAAPVTPRTIPDIFRQQQELLIGFVPKLFTALIIFAIFLLIAGIGKRLIALAAPRVRADTGAVLLLSRVYYYSILSFGLITALATTGLNVSALIAGLGLTGFAFGFALKDVLSNLVAGLMLLIYRPFNIGDHIEMGAYRGRIEDIRMRDTVVRDEADRLIIIPNTKLITEVVINNRDQPTYARLRHAPPPADAVRPPEDTYDDIEGRDKP